MLLTMNCILLCVLYCILWSSFVGRYIEYMKMHCIRNIKSTADHFQEQIKSMQQSLSSKANRSSAYQEISSIFSSENTLLFAVPRHSPQTRDTISTHPTIVFFLPWPSSQRWANASSGRVASPTQSPLLDNTQHLKERHPCAPGGIRNHNPSKRAVADPRLRPCGSWDRLAFLRPILILSSYLQQSIAKWCPSCSGTLLVQQRERLLVSVAGVLTFWRRTFFFKF